MRVLHSVLNMPEYTFTEFWIWQGSARVKQGSKYATKWLYMSDWDVNMPEYI